MAERLAEGVWLLDLGLVKPLKTNCYLVEDGDLTLVDAGLWYNRPSLRAELDDAGFAVSDLDRALVTHYDLDHVAGLRALRGASAPVYMGVEDLALARRETTPPLTHHKGVFHRVVRRLSPLPDDLEYRSVADGDRVGGFEAFHTPGHNPGHTVFVHEGRGAAMLGDLVWGEPGGLTPPFWLDSYDMRELRESIRDLARRVPPFELACMAHGRPITEGGRAAVEALAAGLR